MLVLLGMVVIAGLFYNATKHREVNEEESLDEFLDEVNIIPPDDYFSL